MSLLSKCEDKYFTMVADSMNTDLMTVHTFARTLQREELSTVGCIYLIEATLLHTVKQSSQERMDLWEDVERFLERRASSQETSQSEQHHLGDMGMAVVHLMDGGMDVTEFGKSTTLPTTIPSKMTTRESYCICC